MGTGGVIERFGPKILSAPQLEHARIASAHGKQRLVEGGFSCRDKSKNSKPKGKGFIAPGEEIDILFATKNARETWQ